MDRFIVFGERHLDHLCQEYLTHDYMERSASVAHNEVLANEPLNRPKARGRPKVKRGSIEDEIVPLNEVRCKQRLGGLLKSYSRKAA